MRKRIYILLVGILGFSSCENYLEEVPQDRLAEVNFYKTLADAEAAIYAIYAPIRTGSVFLGPYFLQTEIMADYAEGRGSTAAVGQYQGLDATNIGRTDLLWAGFYRSISYANLAIEKIPGIEVIAAEKKAQLIAEAKFMRAFNYYHLVRNWGAVPLLLATETEYIGRASTADVYAAILTDLQTAEHDLPPEPEQYGRPTSWAAKALMAEVYLTMGNWSTAKTKAAEVINSGLFGLIDVQVANDFDKIFGATVNGTQEEIFYLKYNSQSGWQWPHNLLFVGTQYSPFGNYVIYSTLDNKFLNAWDDDDLRKEFDIFTEYIDRRTGELTTLPASTPVQFSKFRDTNAPDNTGHANDYPFLRFADILLIHAEATCMDEGPTAAGMESLNKIRRRAYGYPHAVPSPADFVLSDYNQASLRDLILQERAYELFMEGKRWLDLKRTGKVQSTILTNLGREVKEAHLNWPIPLQEINTNPDISQSDQNPGY